MTRRRMGDNDPQAGVEWQQTCARLAWFLAGAYPGGYRRKRVARDFDVSMETAKAWLRGEAWPRLENFLAMRRKWGPEFVAFVLSQKLPAMMAEMAARDTEVSRAIEDKVREDARGEAAMVAMADARGSTSHRAGDSGLGRPDQAQAVSMRHKESGSSR